MNKEFIEKQLECSRVRLNLFKTEGLRMFELNEHYIKEQALRDFDLDVANKIEMYTDVEDIINDLRNQSIYKYKTDWKKIVNFLQQEQIKIQIMCDNPTALTIEDRQIIRDMKEYCESQGSFNPRVVYYRKQRTNQVIKEYKKIALDNRMFMLANLDEINQELNKLISLYQDKYTKSREEYKLLRQKDIRDWGCQYYTCVCGLEIQRVNKARHEKTKAHQQYLKNQNPEIEIKPNEYDWHKQKYTCCCGKVVSKGNKKTHENTKYHQVYCNQTTTPKKKYELIIEDDDSVENIILTIGEKSVADDGNEEFSPDDEGFKYF